MPLDGAPQQDLLVLSGSDAWAPDVAPDGSALTFALKTPGSPWRMALYDKGALRIVLESVPDVVWTRFDPTGDTLVFDTRFPTGSRVGRVKLDGTGLVWLTPPESDATYPSLSPDGARLAFVRARGHEADIVLRELGTQSERVLVKSATLPRFSPDGSRLAFAKSRSFAGGIGVVDLAGGEPLVLTASGSWPTWLPDGSAIAYADLAPEGSQSALSVSPRGGEPRRLAGYRWRSIHYPFALSRDGKKLLLTDDAGVRSSIWVAEYD
jgi:Tol biopolymer transport system component